MHHCSRITNFPRNPIFKSSDVISCSNPETSRIVTTQMDRVSLPTKHSFFPHSWFWAGCQSWLLFKVLWPCCIASSWILALWIWIKSGLQSYSGWIVRAEPELWRRQLLRGLFALWKLPAGTRACGYGGQSVYRSTACKERECRDGGDGWGFYSFGQIVS